MSIVEIAKRRRYDTKSQLRYSVMFTIVVKKKKIINREKGIVYEWITSSLYRTDRLRMYKSHIYAGSVKALPWSIVTCVRAHLKLLAVEILFRIFCLFCNTWHSLTTSLGFAQRWCGAYIIVIFRGETERIGL